MQLGLMTPDVIARHCLSHPSRAVGCAKVSSLGRRSTSTLTVSTPDPSHHLARMLARIARARLLRLAAPKTSALVAGRVARRQLAVATAARFSGASPGSAAAASPALEAAVAPGAEAAAASASAGSWADERARVKVALTMTPTRVQRPRSRRARRWT